MTDGQATRRPRATAARIVRLASASARLQDRRDRLDELTERAEALAATDLIVVAGELAVAAELEGQVAAARITLAALEADPHDEDALAQLERLVEPATWDVLEVVDTLLGEKERLFKETAEAVRLALGPWAEENAAVEKLNDRLREAHAVVPSELARGRDRLQDLVRRVDLGISEHRLFDAHLALGELERTPEAEPDQTAPVAAAEVHEQLGEEVKRVERTSGRVQLTVLRGPLADERYEYTLMLLTPGEKRIGVNVQDTSTIVMQDRKWFLQVLRDVGGDAYRALRDARPAASGSATPPVVGVRDLQEMGAVLYKLLIPDRMKDELDEHPEVPLTITTNDLELPWELMFGGKPDENFLALRRSVSRMPVGRSRGRQPRPLEGPVAKRRIALIASAGKKLPLRGVDREVTRIKEKLVEAKLPVEIHVLSAAGSDLRPTGARFREVLLSGGYDIVHYAGHAAFDPARPDQSGLLLDGEELCFAQKIQRLLQGNPLVFLNACETARLKTEDGRPTPEGTYETDPREGLASAFVYGGALACIGTMWPVSDDVAVTFAVAFYTEVLEGQPIGLAMLEARRTTFAVHPNDPSASAFVLYGEPSLQLNPNPLLTPARLTNQGAVP